MALSAEQLCNLLSKSRLLSRDEVEHLYKRWNAQTEGGVKESMPKWLVSQQILTDYQLGVLERNHADSLFLGPYTILERVGRGRMAGVYKAVHELGQIVAIKVLPPSKTKDATTLARFHREAHLALKLKHPNIVRTFQIGEQKRLHYIVMEYLEGEPLEDVLKRRKRLPTPEALHIANKTLLGLQHIHEQGVIHRDIKPANLLLISADPDSTLEAEVKILDIGLGRAMFDEDPEVNTELTSTGEILGEPEYMAPEQAKDSHNVDIRTDIYSLGCTLYEMLTGAPPFVEKSRVRLLIRQASETAKPVREVNPDIPQGVSDVVANMLTKDPEDRYPTPEHVIQALESYLVRTEAPNASAESKSRLSAYLKWVETEEGEGGEQSASPPPTPAAVAPPVPPKAKVPAERVKKASLASPPPAKAPSKAKPVAAVPPQVAPIAKPVKPKPAPRRAETLSDGDIDEIEMEEEDEFEEDEGMFSQRDIMLLAFGGGIVAILVVVGLLLMLYLK